MISRALSLLIINLEQDSERLDLTKAAFGGIVGLDAARSPGVLAANWPATMVRRLGGREDSPGTLGCFLAHVRAWQTVAAMRRPSVIVEDDAEPIHFERLFEAEIPEDADVVFANWRMSDDVSFADGKLQYVDRSDEPVTLADACSILLQKRNWPPNRVGPGGDGYILYPKGARKLLDCVERDGFGGHVDWRILKYALTQDMVASVGEGSWIMEHPVIRPDGRGGWGELTAYRFRRPIIRVRRRTRSSRRSLDGADARA